MKILFGEFMAEVSTFAPGKMDFDKLTALRWSEGEGLFKDFRGKTDFLSGMIEVADKNNVELIPTFATWNAGPMLERETYLNLIEKITDKLTQVKDEISGICFAFHGGGVAEGVADLEADILKKMREIVGEEMPIVITLDLHTNMSKAKLDGTRYWVGCKEYPHVDCDYAGRVAMDILLKTINKEIKPVVKVVQIPLLMAPSQGSTYVEPAKSIKEYMMNYVKEHNLLDASWLHGFPYADVDFLGTSVVVITDNDEALATKAANDIANKIWSHKDDLQANSYDAEGAINKALELLKSEGHPIIINETSDNPGGGPLGNGTHLLRDLLKKNIEKSCFGFIYDPKLASLAHEAGEGCILHDITIGVDTDEFSGGPITVKEAYVKNLSDGVVVVRNPIIKGQTLDLGKSARLVIGNVDVIVCSTPSQTFDDTIFELSGIDVKECSIIALKSIQHYRGFFQDVAAGFVTADTPGYTSSNFSYFKYNKLQRPIYPLNKDISFDIEEIENKAFSI